MPWEVKEVSWVVTDSYTRRENHVSLYNVRLSHVVMEPFPAMPIPNALKDTGRSYPFSISPSLLNPELEGLDHCKLPLRIFIPWSLRRLNQWRKSTGALRERLKPCQALSFPIPLPFPLCLLILPALLLPPHHLHQLFISLYP